MALVFDGGGIVTIPAADASGDFSVVFSSLEITNPGNAEIIFGLWSASNNFVATFAGSLLRSRVDGTTVSGDYSGFDGETLKYEVSRVGSTISHYANDVLVGSSTGTGTFSLDTLGSYNGGSFYYTGTLDGTLLMTGFTGAGDRLYNFSGSGTTLVDLMSGEDGTLSGFTTGGFTAITEDITITSLSNYDCKKRDGSGQAVFTVAGDIIGSAVNIEYSFDELTWSVLDASPSSTFTGDVTVTNQQDITVRFSNSTGVTDKVEKISASLNIGIGPAQSNAVSRVIDAQELTVGAGKPTPIMYKNGTLSELADPTGIGYDGTNQGSLWVWIAQKYSDLGIPVCLGNVAEGGTAISAWLPAGTRYPKLTDFADSVGGLSFAVSLIGESDAMAGTSTAGFKADYLTIATEINTAYGCDIYATYFPVGTSTGTTTNVNKIRTAYDELIAENVFIKFGGDLAVIDISSATDPLNDDLHIKLSPDAVTASQIMYNAQQGIPTTLNFTVTGLSNETRDCKFFDWTNEIHISTETVSFDVDGNASVSLDTTESTVVVGAYLGVNPDVTGSGIYGVTE